MDDACRALSRAAEDGDLALLRSQLDALSLRGFRVCSLEETGTQRLSLVGIALQELPNRLDVLRVLLECLEPGEIDQEAYGYMVDTDAWETFSPLGIAFWMTGTRSSLSSFCHFVPT
jgi:hypothetical protein